MCSGFLRIEDQVTAEGRGENATHLKLQSWEKVTGFGQWLLSTRTTMVMGSRVTTRCVMDLTHP